MKTAPAALLLAALLPGLAVAQDAALGDPAAGEAVFERQCTSCHVVRDEGTGEVLAGGAARTGPNLWGVVGRLPGSHPDHAYSRSMVAYGATGAAWTEATIAPYVQDPTGFLREALGDPRARGRMAYQVRDEAEARDVAAYLATFAAPD